MPEKKEQPLKNSDFDYLNDCREATLMKRTPYASLLIYILIGFLVVFFIWAKLAVLDEVTRAEGKVIPPSEVKTIQNLEGGIISEILVREGEAVKKGQILIRIDDTRFASQYREQRAQYLALVATVARLTAETENKEKVDYPEVLKDQQAITSRENRLFDQRKKALDESIKTLQRSYDFTKKELDMTAPLVAEGVTSKIELLRLQRQVNELQGQIDEKKDSFYEDAHSELNKKQAELDALTESLMSQQDRVTRTTIRSPVDGTVKTININTIGGVIQPGMEILDIVPTEDYLIVQAKVKPKDIGFVKLGQKAKVKFTAYDFSIYGGLDGKVTYISADTITDEKEKQTYYEVLVRTNKTYLGTEQHPLPLKVGMVTNVDILTGRKSVLSYLLKPLLKAKQNAFTER